MSQVRYYTACDVGTYPEDMDTIARDCQFVTGRSVTSGGAGDSSTLTVYGVFEAMRAAADHLWRVPTLSGLRIGIHGLGKVGAKLVDHLINDGAHVVIADVSKDAVQGVLSRHPQVEAVDHHDLARTALDIYAPCALGGALTSQSAATLRAQVICGAANNQMAEQRIHAASPNAAPWLAEHPPNLANI